MSNQLIQLISIQGAVTEIKFALVNAICVDYNKVKGVTLSIGTWLAIMPKIVNQS